MENYFDVIVVGGGHAGIEACLSASRMGCKTLLITLSESTIGLMSCNPAIGGIGKGQLVKEIDALGGEMAKATDKTGIQFRILNRSKGPAVQSSRAQVDMNAYRQYMRNTIKSQNNLEIFEAETEKLIIESNIVKGVKTNKQDFFSKTVILCPGTFLDGLIHIGLTNKPGGRINEPSSKKITDNLKELGFNLLRFKTGTCPRLNKNTIDFTNLIIQEGDNPPVPFSFSTDKIIQKQVPCYITHTNKNTHKIIRDNLNRSPLYTGIIKSTGVRYCPSIEDKIVKFADKEQHQIFLEPVGLDTDEIYPNGLSTSLPEDVQIAMLHTIKGLENVEVIRFGYGIEHTVVDPTQLYPTLETKLIKNLYLAGQINGTTGYEEAASQGLIAGINSALRVQDREPLILDRSQSYIGVLIDDLTTKGTNEPYRMFTSRVEYRMIIREDNADLRLRKIGYELGLISKEDYTLTQEKQNGITSGLHFLKNTVVFPTEETNKKLKLINSSPIRKPTTLEELLKRPEIDFTKLKKLFELQLNIPEQSIKQIEIETKYSGYIKIQISEIEKFKNLEKIKIPSDWDYLKIPGLSREIKEKLSKYKPVTLGQASRISGITPSAISILMMYLKRIDRKNIA